MRGIAWLSTVLVAIAGCTGSPNGNPTAAGPQAETVSGPAGFDETSGGIEGTVLDDESAPVAGAIVGLIDLSRQAQTDAAGFYAISNVAPGDHQIAAQMLGFTSAAKRVDVRAGEVTKASFVLTRIQIHEGYHSTFEKVGYFECSWTGAGGTGPCFFPYVGQNSAVPVDPWTNNRRQFDWAVDAGTMTVLNELTWDRTTAATGDSMSTFLSYANRTTSHTYCSVASSKPVLLRWDRALESTSDKDKGVCARGSGGQPASEPQTIPMAGQYLTSRVNTGPGNVPGSSQSTIVGVAFQQSFKMYLSAFYWDHAPPDWTALRDA